MLSLALLLFSIPAGCSPRSEPHGAPEERSEPLAISEERDPADPLQLTVAPGADNEQFVGPLADAYRRLDPEADGWQSEVFGQAAQDQLNQLATWITTGTGASELATIVAQSLVMDGLYPPHARVVFRRDSLIVTRAQAKHNNSGSGEQGTNSGNPQPEAKGRGARTMRRNLAKLASRFQAGHPEHVKFKIYRVIPHETEADTLVLFHADGATRDGLLEISATWRCRWTITKSSPPRLTELRVEDFEMVELTERTEPLFADCTASLLGHEKAYHRQLLLGTDHWRARISRDLGLDVVANHGLALGDVDGDLLEDVYVCQQGGLPNLLFLHRPVRCSRQWRSFEANWPPRESPLRTSWSVSNAFRIVGRRSSFSWTSKRALESRWRMSPSLPPDRRAPACPGRPSARTAARRTAAIPPRSRRAGCRDAAHSLRRYPAICPLPWRRRTTWSARESGRGARDRRSSSARDSRGRRRACIVEVHRN